MRVEGFARGAKFEVVALDRSDTIGHPNVPARDFINALGVRARKAMIHRIQQHADHGPLKNIQQCRDIGDKIWEFKTSLGDRILWFYEGNPGNRTILTNGFSKGESLKVAQARAVQMRGEWILWQATLRR